MLYHLTTAEYARRLHDERQAAAERRHRLFRRPIESVRPSALAPVVALPGPITTHCDRVA